jgi:hypothetical protein
LIESSTVSCFGKPVGKRKFFQTNYKKVMNIGSARNLFFASRPGLSAVVAETGETIFRANFFVLRPGLNAPIPWPTGEAFKMIHTAFLPVLMPVLQEACIGFRGLGGRSENSSFCPVGRYCS